MKHAAIGLTATVLLTACGGGGTTPTGEAFSTVKTYADGSGVVKATRDLGAAGGMSNMVLISTDNSTALSAISGDINLTEVDGANDPPFYVVVRTGQAGGKTIDVFTSGRSLLPLGEGYASVSILEIDGDLGVLSGGTVPQNLPIGTFNYSGAISILGGDGPEDGTFVLTANFLSKTGAIQGNTGTYFLNANSLTINPSDASFSTTNATIGTTGLNVNDASVLGYFAGINGTGVHGAAYGNNPAGASHVAVFYGSR